MKFTHLPIIAALCVALISLPVAGCSGSQVAQDIVNWTPALQSAVQTVDASAAVLDPAAAPIFAAATVGFDAASNVLVAEARAYLANPSASKLSLLQTAVTTFQQNVNAATLQAAKITNPASQQAALSALNNVATIVNTILALVGSISGTTALNHMADQSTIKLAQVAPYEDLGQQVRMIAAHYGESQDTATRTVLEARLDLQRAGF